MKHYKLKAIVASLAILLGVVSAVIVPHVLGGSDTNTACATLANGPPVSVTVKSVGQFNTPAQIHNAQIIIGVAKGRGLSARDAAITLGTAMGESSLINVLVAVNASSLGLFQQQPTILKADGTPYWGTPEQVTDPTYATNRFIDELLAKVPERASLTFTQTIHKVQANADPNFYTPFEAPATQMVDQAYGTAGQSDATLAAASVATSNTGLTGVRTGSVYQVGDSLTRGLFNSGIVAKYAAAGHPGSVVNGLSGRRITGGPTPDGLDQVKADTASIKNASAVVVALGTNHLEVSDNASNFGQVMQSLITAIRQAKPNQRIFWVNVASVFTTKFGEINLAINQVAARNQVRVIDWFSQVFPGADPTKIDTSLVSKDRWLESDVERIHPNAAGYQAMGNFIVAQVNTDASVAQVGQACSTSVTTGDVGGRFIWPIAKDAPGSGTSQCWNMLPGHHPGMDIFAPTGTPIRAMAAGTVIRAGEKNSGYGIEAKIDHHNGFWTQYGHMSQVLVTEGQVVKQGDIIGLVGSTGHSTGPHLHFNVDTTPGYGHPQTGDSLNPIDFLPVDGRNLSASNGTTCVKGPAGYITTR